MKCIMFYQIHDIPLVISRKHLIFLVFLCIFTSTTAFCPFLFSGHCKETTRRIYSLPTSAYVHPSQDNDVGGATDESPLEQSFRHLIHRVNSRARALDILVFRHGRLVTSLEDHLMKNPTQTREDALNYLTSTYDEQGQSLEFSGGVAGELVQFFALAENMEFANWGGNCAPSTDYSLHQDFLERTHGVIGSIDAFKIPRRDIAVTAQVSLIELKNLRVHDSGRRLGIGRSLVKAVQQFAQKVKEEEPGGAIVYLYYDSNNMGAFRLYEKAGFIVDEDDANRMTWVA
jgi:ribosomal protein S18 acetylase RimI-like enzyme